MNNENLSIGFIGAGRVGFTLGRYFFEKKLKLSGYFSKTCEHACEAAVFTHSKSYKTLRELAEESTVIFITVPDSDIENVYLQLKNFELKDKILCHCSGALSAGVFEGIDAVGAYGYSVHPIFAINDKMNSYREISKAFFTIEGSKEKMSVMKAIFQKVGNPVQVIEAESKHKYHTSLVMASNLVIGLYHIAAHLLEECGFSDSAANEVLKPLFLNNAENLCKTCCADALTGPVDRNDTNTVREHLSALGSNDKSVTDIYRLLSDELIKIAKQKYPDRNYDDLKNILNKE